MSLIKIIGYLDLALFWGLMLFFKTEKNRLFILFTLYSFIFLHVKIIPEVSLFDFTVVTYFFLFYKKRAATAKDMILYGFLLALYLVDVFLGLYLSQVYIDAANYLEIFKIFPVFLFAKILIDECIHNHDFREEIAVACRRILLFSLVFLLIQMFVGVSFSLFPSLNSNVIINGAIRYPGIFSDPQQFSQFLGAFSFLALLQFDSSKPVPKSSYVMVIAAIIGILAAGGRAGLLGWAVGFGLLLLFSKMKVKMGMIALAGMITLIAFNFQDQLSIFKRSTDMNETYEFREMIWNEALQISSDHPVTGIGLDNYQKYVKIYNPNQVWEMHEALEAFDQPESGYLKILTEVGGLGFLCLMLIIFIPAFKSIFNFFRTRDLNFILLVAALLAWSVGFYSTYSLGEVRIKMYLGLIVSLMIIQNHLSKQPIVESDLEIEEDIENEKMMIPTA